MHLYSQYGDGSIEFGNNNEFDVLIFTQRWPITACIEWMEKASDNVCILPSQKNVWGIHGIWPTRIGTMGPFFCNKSATFDIDTLKPIMEQLDLNWLNIEKGIIKCTIFIFSLFAHEPNEFILGNRFYPISTI